MTFRPHIVPAEPERIDVQALNLADIARRDWDTVHVVADKAPALSFVERIKRTWRKCARAVHAVSDEEAQAAAGPGNIVVGYDEEDEEIREYCRKVARAVIEATGTAPRG